MKTYVARVAVIKFRRPTDEGITLEVRVAADRKSQALRRIRDFIPSSVVTSVRCERGGNARKEQPFVVINVAPGADPAQVADAVVKALRLDGAA